MYKLNNLRGQTQMDNTKTVYVVVALEVLRDADVHDIMSECDYSFEHSDIVDTELMGETDYA
jgi:hypothetical protein